MLQSPESIRKELESSAHGSEKEQAVLERVRQAKAAQRQNFQGVRDASYEQESGEHRVLSNGAAREAAHIAIKQVTEEHEIPVHIEQHPVEVHKVPQIN